MPAVGAIPKRFDAVLHYNSTQHGSFRWETNKQPNLLSQKQMKTIEKLDHLNQIIKKTEKFEGASALIISPHNLEENFPSLESITILQV